MKTGKGVGLFCVFLFLILFFTPGGAQEKKAGSAKGFGFMTSRSPIEITSDTVEGDQKQNRVAFKGNVVAKQEEATLYANLVVVHYDTEMKKIKEIVATGNVRIVQLDRRATCQKATFFQNENKIVLDGEAVIREGDNIVRGERVIYLVDEERSYVEGGKGSRVTTTIVPSSKEERKKQ
ncbi:MAG: lipopolysaccharide transport periplasmic protein LptA [Deltaproteobacteria bacterium RBG_16_49_23]|nr:MAG: lipopolysaccharide transport periplasmic protein LptA [Deltaproteobacteria bacterium RBG_16_49_23]